MSAWILSPRHINEIVAGAIRLELIDKADAQRVGRMLTNANKRSIRARYGEDDEGAARVEPFWFRGIPREPISDVSLFKQVRCYDYQTCEFDGYETSSAGRFMAKMERVLAKRGVTHESPGYNEAPWGL